MLETHPDHIDHIRDVVGIEAVGMGSDMTTSALPAGLGGSLEVPRSSSRPGTTAK